jgi:hypothetical protein
MVSVAGIDDLLALPAVCSRIQHPVCSTFAAIQSGQANGRLPTAICPVPKIRRTGDRFTW